MTDEDQVKASISPFDTVWLTIKGEAESEPIEGQVAVAWVIKNRVLHPGWMGTDYKSVCLHPAQFDCWWPDRGGADYERVMVAARLVLYVPMRKDDQVTRQMKAVATAVMAGDFLDNTGGSVQYLTEAEFKTNPPLWARNVPKALLIGSQVFLPSTGTSRV